MKIAQIRKLILEQKSCVIMTGEMKQQWIGGNAWMARVDEGLKITSESIKGLFDLSVEQMDKLQITECPLETYPLWPVMRRDMNEMKVALVVIDNYGGVETLTCGNAVYLLERKYVKAAVSNDDYRAYTLAWDSGNNPLIVIQDGYIFAGIARPMIADVCKLTLEQMRLLGEMTPGGTRAPEENSPLKLEPEGGIQIDMADFKEETDDDGDA